ncbi:phage portal protein [Sphingomonas jatrophae]|uniref:Phage portal protein, HK97 family n=1 Tax=Sphingomonas jatrophae TaxID=1166337 RepID=A0A1I6L485_9SPHN|nr:phage portal protein [Sphingomonas jatrophae]SFR98088.1 phage portal protein, HK97 family [Sphingomonas jatrophae]
MKLFGRRPAGEGVRPALSGGMRMGTVGGDTPISYETELREAYLRNPVAQRAVRIVAEGVASLTLKGEARLIALVRTTSAGQSLLEAVAAQLVLHGNAYVQVAAGADGMPCELYALRPERVTPELDARGWPVAYRYRAGETVQRFATAGPDGQPQAIHIRTQHPLDDHLGIGCLGAAMGAVTLHNPATRWNRALLDNAARPSGALVYDPGERGAALTREQYERLQAEMERTFAGAANAGRPMLLEGGLKWQALSLSPADMDFVGLKAAAAREIALAFGVPPMLLGLPGDATYANYAEANRALWRLTILPLATKILDGLVQALRGWWPEAALAPDLDAVPALAADRELLWRQVAAADFLSPDEKRAMLGIEAAG